MKGEAKIVLAGIAMVASGLVLFYSIPGPDIDGVPRILKHSGTFVGLMGIGVSVAGMLLYLISRNQRQFDGGFP